MGMLIGEGKQKQCRKSSTKKYDVQKQPCKRESTNEEQEMHLKSTDQQLNLVRIQKAKSKPHGNHKPKI